MKIIALGNINSGQHVKGDVFIVDNDEARSLINAGAAAEVIEETPVVETIDTLVVETPTDPNPQDLQTVFEATGAISTPEQPVVETPVQPVYQEQPTPIDIQLN
jgi:hypothetical protein